MEVPMIYKMTLRATKAVKGLKDPYTTVMMRIVAVYKLAGEVHLNINCAVTRQVYCDLSDGAK